MVRSHSKYIRKLEDDDTGEVTLCRVVEGYIFTSSRSDNHNPELWWAMGGKKKGVCSRNQMTILALGDTIMSMSPWIGGLEKGALLREEIPKSNASILVSRITSKNTNGRI